MNTGAIFTSNYIFGVSNSLLDTDWPYVWSSNDNPLTFAEETQMSNIYGRSRVLKMIIEVEACANVSTELATLWYYPSNVSASTLSSIESVMEQPGAKTASLLPSDSNPQYVRMTMTQLPWVTAGITKQEYMNDNNYAQYDQATPATKVCAVFGIVKNNGTVFAASQSYSIRVRVAATVLWDERLKTDET